MPVDRIFVPITISLLSSGEKFQNAGEPVFQCWQQCGWVKDDYGISWQFVPKLTM
jgi:predicted 3-demethylubiquinone-9 3-methyltransferase (glyoxalase superfamily)